MEYVKEGSDWYLRAYIDKEGGITVNDCEMVAREMNEAFCLLFINFFSGHVTTFPSA